MPEEQANDGWVRLYRSSLDSEVFASPNLWKVWSWCLLKANHAEAFVPITTGRGVTTVKVLPGQFIFGRFTAGKELRMRPTTARDLIRKLADMQNLATQPSTHYTLITITKWADFQRDGRENKSQSANQPPTNRQPTATNKNDKNDKKEEEAIASSSPPAANDAAAAEKPREPNPLWDGICAAFNLHPATRGECARIGRIVRDLKIKDADPSEIPRRMANYRRWWPKIHVTPEGLLKHWDMVAAPPKARSLMEGMTLCTSNKPAN